LQYWEEYGNVITHSLNLGENDRFAVSRVQLERAPPFETCWMFRRNLETIYILHRPPGSNPTNGSGLMMERSLKLKWTPLLVSTTTIV